VDHALELLIALSCIVISQKSSGTIIIGCFILQSLSAGERRSSNRTWVPLSRWSCQSPPVMHRYLVLYKRIKQMRDMPVSFFTKLVHDLDYLSFEGYYNMV
jgi:hypothetical protein